MESLKKKPLLKKEEKDRIEVLKRYQILDTPPDGSFDRITKLAAKLLNVPISIVSLVDMDRIWFKSRFGLDVQEITRDPGLCASAIMADDFYMVEDARNDPRTLTNPLVAGEFGLQFYAAAPLKTQEGFNLGTLCVIDRKPRTLTSEEKEILQSLADLVMNQIELRLEARTAVRFQHQVLGTAAHDLKNPLSMMPLLADMIMQNKDNPDAIDDISKQIKTAGRRMAKIIDNLLENAKVGTDHVQLRLDTIEFDKLVKGVADSNNALAKKKKQDLKFLVKTSSTIYGDREKLTEVIDNLINNAIKYSSPGKKIEVIVDVYKNKAIFQVADEGPGLTKDDMKNLFRPFTSLSAQPTGGENSTGLGLSIAHRLVEAHQGKIYAESEGAGKGTTFIVELPLSQE